VLTVISIRADVEEVVAAAVLQRKYPALRVHVINVTDLMILEAETLYPYSLTNDEFNALSTLNKPIHFNYQGYSNEIKGLLFGGPDLHRVFIECFKEEGRTSTSFNMIA